MIWWFLIVGILLTGVTGIPIGVGLSLTGLAILHFLVGGATALSVSAVWNVLTDFIMSAVPLFIFMGEILLVSGISNRVYTAFTPMFQRMPGKLLHTNIAVCTMFGAVSGTSMSTAAAIGSVAYPELKRRGYSPPFVVATLAAGGTLGLLIPPSLSLLIYGATQGVSIGRLFLAGILPGLLMALLFMLVIFVRCLRHNNLCPPQVERTPLTQQIAGLIKIWPLGILIFAVLGTIYAGLATPTEAAGLGVAASIVIGFTWGDLTWARLLAAFQSSIFVFGTIGFVLIGALTLAQAISAYGLPYQTVEAIGHLEVSKYTILGLVVIVYLILGMFFDGVSLMLMTLPVVYPVMTALGFDPIWLGVVITILVEVCMVTPPVGINLYVLVAITKGDVTLAQAAAYTVPFWIMLLVGLLLFTIFPEIVLFLPNTLG
jgi:C4-dicarboxylate transporter, DctM subunit